MKKVVLKALKASIAKWEKNTTAMTSKEFLCGTDDCPLCTLFHKKDCAGCPIAEKTGHIFCGGTPYTRTAWHYDNWSKQERGWVEEHPQKNTSRRLAILGAKREVKFLKSLLPKDEGQ